jgi:hypothetical protein
MDTNYTVERVSLHFVDRGLPGPRFSQREVDLSTFKNPDDVRALQVFFHGHLENTREAEEGRRTIAANFNKDSPLPTYRDEIAATLSLFHPHSCEMAQRLYDVSKGVTASPGLLMVLWFTRVNDKRRFLGLFKMDPGPSHKIILETSGEEETLLQLAVQHLEQVLPDPRDQVLKWAVIPHPTRPTFDLKAKDQEGGADPAQYFINFLGCEPKPSERQQVYGLLSAIHAYAEESHPKEDWESTVRELEEELEEEPFVTADTVTELIRRRRTFVDFDEAAFQQKLAAHGAAELATTSTTFRKTRLKYELPSGIVIIGPRTAMLDLVHKESRNGETEFRIRTPSYKESYV